MSIHISTQSNRFLLKGLA